MTPTVSRKGIANVAMARKLVIWWYWMWRREWDYRQVREFMLTRESSYRTNAAPIEHLPSSIFRESSPDTHCMVIPPFGCKIDPVSRVSAVRHVTTQIVDELHGI
jgi:hypothetical protein